MKSLRKILIGFFVFVALFFIIGLFLPGTMHVERTASIRAPVAKVFPLVADMHSWPAWSPWHKTDPKIQLEYFGPRMGKGAGYSWSSNHKKVGNGRMTITAYEENRTLQTRMDFMENGTAGGGFRFEPEGNSTRVTWYMDSDTRQGNFFMKALGGYFGLIFKGMIADDFDRGLDGLKKEAEAAGE